VAIASHEKPTSQPIIATAQAVKKLVAKSRSFQVLALTGAAAVTGIASVWLSMAEPFSALVVH
jgi:hypothetical protein